MGAWGGGATKLSLSGAWLRRQRGGGPVPGCCREPHRSCAHSTCWGHTRLQSQLAIHQLETLGKFSNGSEPDLFIYKMGTMGGRGQ